MAALVKQLLEGMIKGGTKLSDEALQTVISKHGDDLSQAITSGNKDDFIAAVGKIDDPAAAGFLKTMEGNLDGIKALEEVMQSGAEITAKAVQDLGLKVSDDAAQAISVHLKTISQEYLQTAASKQTSSQGLDGLAGLSDEGKKARDLAEKRRLEREAKQKAEQEALEQTDELPAPPEDKSWFGGITDSFRNGWRRITGQGVEETTKKGADDVAKSADDAAGQATKDASQEVGEQVAKEPMSKKKKFAIVAGATLTGVAIAAYMNSDEHKAASEKALGQNVPTHLMDEIQFNKYLQATGAEGEEIGELREQRLAIMKASGLANDDGTINSPALIQARHAFNTEQAAYASIDKPFNVGAYPSEHGKMPMIPPHLMEKADFEQYLQSTQANDPDFDIEQARLNNQTIQMNKGLIGADGALNQAELKQQQEAFNNEVRTLLGHKPDASAKAKEKPDAKAAGDDPAAKSGMGMFGGGFQELINGIMQFINMLAGMFGFSGFGSSFGPARGATPNPASTGAGSKPSASPTPGPTPSTPKVDPAVATRQQLSTEYNGYLGATRDALKNGQLSGEALDVDSIKWSKSEMISGDADFKRILDDNINAGLTDGQTGMLHIDEDRGFVYIHQDANGDVQAYVVNDQLNKIPNIDKLNLSSQSIVGLSNAMMINDRHAGGKFDPQKGMIKTVEVEDPGGIDDDIKFHVRVDGQGRYQISPINDAYEEANGGALKDAKGQTLNGIGGTKASFDYYLQGKDPVDEGLIKVAHRREVNPGDVPRAAGEAVQSAIKGVLGSKPHIRVDDGEISIRGMRGLSMNNHRSPMFPNHETLIDNDRVFKASSIISPGG